MVAERHFRIDDLQSNLKQRVLRGGGVTFLFQGLKFLLQLAGTAALARLLLPADFGLVAMVTAISGFLVVFREMGLSLATVQRDTINHAEVSNLFWINVAVGAGLMLVLWAAAPWVARFYRDDRLLAITTVIATTFFLSGLTVQHQALLRRRMRFVALAWIDLGALVVGLGLAVILAALGGGYWALVAMGLGKAFVELIGFCSVCRWVPGWPKRGTDVCSLLSFGVHMTLADILGYIANNFDKLILGKFVGAEPLGLYSRAQAVIAVPMQQLTGPMNAVGIPALSRVACDREKFREAFLGIYQFVVILLPPMVVFIIVGADWLVLLLLGPQWLEAVPLFAIFGLVAFTKPVASVCIWVFVTQGRTESLLRWTALNTGLVLVAFLGGLPWGILGVAAAYSVSGFLVRTPVLFWFAGRVSTVRTRDFYELGLPYTLLGLVVLCLVQIGRQLAGLEQPVLGLLALLPSVLVLYTAGIFLWPSARAQVQQALIFFQGRYERT